MTHITAEQFCLVKLWQLSPVDSYFNCSVPHFSSLGAMQSCLPTMPKRRGLRALSPSAIKSWTLATSLSATLLVGRVKKIVSDNVLSIKHNLVIKTIHKDTIGGQTTAPPRSSLNLILFLLFYKFSNCTPPPSTQPASFPNFISHIPNLPRVVTLINIPEIGGYYLILILIFLFSNITSLPFLSLITNYSSSYGGIGWVGQSNRLCSSGGATISVSKPWIISIFFENWSSFFWNLKWSANIIIGGWWW